MVIDSIEISNHVENDFTDLVTEINLDFSKQPYCTQRKQELKVLSVIQKEIYFVEKRETFVEWYQAIYIQAGDLTIRLSVNCWHGAQTAVHLW